MWIVVEESVLIRLKEEDKRFFYYKNSEKYFSMHPDISTFLDEQLSMNPWFKTKKLLFKAIANDIFDIRYCAECGMEMSIEFVLSTNPVRQYCSSRCGHGSELSKKRRNETNVRKYGVTNPACLKEVKEKQKRTFFERYGVENPVQSKEIREKIRQTNINKYGTEHFSHSDIFKDKYRKTMLEKYGVEHPLQSKEIREKHEKTMLERYGNKFSMNIEKFDEKRKKTNLERYGVEYASQNEAVKHKSEEAKKKTNLERYGVENVFQTMEVQEKIKKTNLEKYGAENPVHSEQIKKRIFKKNYQRILERIKDYVVPLFTEDEYHGWKNENYGRKYKWKCVRCGCEFEQHFHSTNFADDSFYIPQCPSCFPKEGGVSMEEKDFILFLKEIYHGEIIENSRLIIQPFELDVYLPELKIAFEFDGLYWHSEKKKDSKYHLEKTEECERNGIRLVHVFEDEWIRQKNIVKDRICSIVGAVRQRIYARKCIVKEIDSSTSNEFLNMNHLQGGDKSPIRYGLFYNDELVSVMTFGKPRFNKNYDWELVRFASKIGMQVVGGASKLLARFGNEHCGSIISYADRRYSDGKLYESIGFSKIACSAPNYFWIIGMKRYSRYQCQKHKLPALLGDLYNENLSEAENMQLNGYYRIYDCGNIVYSLNKLDEMAQ